MNDPGILVAFGLIIIAVVIVRRVLIRRAARANAGPSPREEGLERVKEVNRRRNLENLLVEIHDVTRELTARVDNKLRAVSIQTEKNKAFLEREKVLLEKITLLEKRIAELEKSGPVQGSSSRSSGGLEDDHLDQYREIFDRHDNGESILDIAEKTNRHQGEVELILGMRKTKEAARG